jgi:hypothetical protein
MADPEKDLAIAIVFNGMCGDAKHTIRVNETLTRVYEDLGM